MSNPTYFIQECPTCGRRLQIRVEHLGRRVVCQHCQGRLIATDPANARCDRAELGNALLRRADELLETIAQRRPQPR
jgi:DNA-directed RNA polymerase subunit RPC12/RpoP